VLCVNCYATVIPKVLEYPHCIRNSLLTVEPYYKWLGSASAGVSVVRTPHTDSVTVVYEPKALDYIMQSRVMKSDIEAQLERNSCTISWPKKSEDALELKFKQSGDHKYAGQEWADKCTSVMNTFLSDIHCETVDVLQEIWNNFKSHLSEHMKHQSCTVKYEFDDDQCDVNFVGKKDAVEKFRMMVDRVKTGLEEELRKKHEVITETMTTLSRHQLMILCLCNYSDEVAATVGKDVKVIITQNELNITGMPDEVKRVKVKVYQKVSELQSDMMTVSKAVAELMEKDCVKSYLQEYFTHRQVVASWSLRDTELSIFAFSKDELVKAKELIKSVVIEKDFPLDASSKSLLSQPRWNEFEKQLIDEHKMVAVHRGSDDRLVLCCTQECSGAVQDKVQNFIEKNSLVEKLEPLLRPVADLLEQFMSSDLVKVRSRLEQCGGHMKRSDSETEPGFVMLGSRSAVDLASSELTKLTESLAMYDHDIDRPGIPAYLTSTQGTAILSGLQRKHNVIIDLESCGTSAGIAGGGEPGGGRSSVVKCSRKVMYWYFLLVSVTVITWCNDD